MYLLSETEQHVRASLRDAILLLCQTGLKYNTELSVEGLLAVTVDRGHVLLLSLKETLQANEPRCTSDDATLLSTDDNPAIMNSSSACMSAVTSVGSDDPGLSNGSAEELSHNQLPSQLVKDVTQRDVQSAAEHIRASRHHHQHRKRRHTLRRFKDTLCPPPGDTIWELLGQTENISDCVGKEVGDTPVCSAADDQCNESCVNELLSDTTDLQSATTDELTSAESTERGCNDVIRSLSLPSEQTQCDSRVPIVAPPTNQESVTNSDCVSKRSHRKQTCTVRRYLDSSSCPMTSSPATPLSYTPAWSDDESCESAVVIGVTGDHRSQTCKTELSDEPQSSTSTECRDFSVNCCLSADVKSEIVEPASADIASSMTSVGHSVVPTADRHQQMAMMSPFGLSAMVASMQSHFALLPKPFPWSAATFPSLSPSSVPTAHCGMLLGPSSSVAVKGNLKTCRYPKTPLNIPTINSYRRLNGVKASPFLSPEVNVCANCGATRTTVWRRLENKQILCNACGCYYKLHKIHRPLSLVRHEIRSRCRGPKMSTLMKASKSRFNGVVVAHQSSPDVALNLTTTSPRGGEPN